MARRLPVEQIARYGEDGFLSPLRAMEEDEARGLRARLEAFEATRGGRLSGDELRKLHLLLPWVADLVRHPAILDAVEDLIGPDILLFHLMLWVKEPRTDAFVSWHQDSTYFGLSPADHVTAWFALSVSDEASGCVQAIPGSQRAGQVRHDASPEAANLFATGQRIGVAEDAPTARMVLRPGEFSLHHTHLFHTSAPNRSEDRRIGFGISYIPARCRCSASVRLSASLVRGVDRFGHFEREARPVASDDPAARAEHAAAMARWHAARKELIAAAHADAA